MTTPVRFAYAHPDASRTEGSLLAYVPITLRHDSSVLTVTGLLDTGATVNVLPYSLGLQLGLVWEHQTTRGEHSTILTPPIFRINSVLHDL